MRNAWIWIVVIVIIVVGGFLWWQSSQSGNTTVNLIPTDTTQTTQTTTETASTTAQTATTTESATGSDTTASGAVTITYDGKGFTPSSVTVKKGQSVKWVNASNGEMWVASASHPSHTGYDGTSRSAHCAPGYSGGAPFDQCKGDGDYTFTFDKAGTWSYHDHINPTAFGKVIVTE